MQDLSPILHTAVTSETELFRYSFFFTHLPGIVSYMQERANPDWKAPPEAVVTLTTENFTDFIQTNDLALVEFYAPW